MLSSPFNKSPALIILTDNNFLHKAPLDALASVNTDITLP